MLKDYILGDTGGKKFPKGKCPSFKAFSMEVFGPEFRWWPMQRLVLKVIINTIGLFPPIPLTQWEQQRLDEMIENAKQPDEDTKYAQAVVRRDPNVKSPVIVLLVMGRGSGKTTMAGTLIAYFCLFLVMMENPHKFFGLAKMKPIMMQCLAGKETQAVSLFRVVKSAINKCMALNGAYDEKQESVNFGNVVEAMAYTSNANTVRGSDTFCYYHEETAFCGEDTPENEKSFTQCYAAIQPAVKNRFGGNGVMIFVTSAGMKKGKTWNLYRQIKNGTIKNCVMFQLAAWEINPKWTKEDFSQEYKEDAVTADAEHGSQFVDSINTFLSRKEVFSCIDMTQKRTERGNPGIHYWMRIDPSKRHDRYGLAIGHKEYHALPGGGRKIVAVIDHIEYWEPHWTIRETGEPCDKPKTMKERVQRDLHPVNPQDILTAIEELMTRFNIIGVSSDQFESQYIIEELNDRHGSELYPFGFVNYITEKSNWLAYRNFKKLINTQCFKIYNEPAFIEEALVAMRYNKNKPLDSVPDELFGGEFDELEGDEKVDDPNLIFTVKAPRSGAVKTDDILDSAVFCTWDMMQNMEMAPADLSQIGTYGTRETANMDKQVANPYTSELGDMPERF